MIRKKIPSLIAFTLLLVAPPSTRASTTDSKGIAKQGSTPRASASPSGSPSPSTAAALPTFNPPKPGGPALLWEAWYTVTVNRKLHYAYYYDRVERRGEKVYYQNQMWKQEEGFINEEQLGTVSADDADLTPLLYNFHSTYRTTETRIDGKLEKGRQFTVKITKGSTEFPVVRKSVPDGTILSAVFPVWMSRKGAGLEAGKTVSFYAIPEDNIENNFSPVSGRARIEAPDAFSLKNHAVRVSVTFKDVPSTWWISPEGAPVRIEFPTQQSVIERVPRAEAQSFLNDE